MNGSEVVFATVVTVVDDYDVSAVQGSRALRSGGGISLVRAASKRAVRYTTLPCGFWMQWALRFRITNGPGHLFDNGLTVAIR
jgi:hypothetical protein